MDPYIGEIRMFGGNFAPQGWNFCDGSLLSIVEYDTLFQLINTTYGGDGQSTFSVPDLRGRVPLNQGTGPGLFNYTIGQIGGVEQVALITQQLPVHNHALVAAGTPGDTNIPSSTSVPAFMGPTGETRTNTYITYDGSTQVTLAGGSIGVAGASQAHSNIQPTLAINYIISLFGIYPSQN